MLKTLKTLGPGTVPGQRSRTKNRTLAHETHIHLGGGPYCCIQHGTILYYREIQPGHGTMTYSVNNTGSCTVSVT